MSCPKSIINQLEITSNYSHDRHKISKCWRCKFEDYEHNSASNCAILSQLTLHTSKRHKQKCAWNYSLFSPENAANANPKRALHIPPPKKSGFTRSQYSPTRIDVWILHPVEHPESKELCALSLSLSTEHPGRKRRDWSRRRPLSALAKSTCCWRLRRGFPVILPIEGRRLIPSSSVSASSRLSWRHHTNHRLMSAQSWESSWNEQPALVVWWWRKKDSQVVYVCSK